MGEGGVGAPGAGELLAVVSYAGADRVRQLRDLYVMLNERHRPVVADGGQRAVCGSCRGRGGRRHEWPCPTWIDTELIMGHTYSPGMFEALGAEVPAALLKPRVIDSDSEKEGDPGD